MLSIVGNPAMEPMAQDVNQRLGRVVDGIARLRPGRRLPDDPVQGHDVEDQLADRMVVVLAACVRAPARGTSDLSVR